MKMFSPYGTKEDVYSELVSDVCGTVFYGHCHIETGMYDAKMSAEDFYGVSFGRILLANKKTEADLKMDAIRRLLQWHQEQRKQELQVG
jgi:hypothetical protein